MAGEKQLNMQCGIQFQDKDPSSQPHARSAMKEIARHAESDAKRIALKTPSSKPRQKLAMKNSSVL